MCLKTFQEIKSNISKKQAIRISVAAAEDKEVLLAVKEAVDIGLATFHLIGDKEKILEYAKEINLSIDGMEVTNELDPTQVSRIAVESVSSGKSHILMKGLIPTATMLKAVLNKEIGLRTGKILSHVATFELEGFDRLLFLTDAAMNIAPDLEQKLQITQNAVDFVTSIGIEKPKVAAITAVETVNPNMQATIDAALLAKMADRGQLTNGLLDGPLAFDIAISMEAAKHKGIDSKVAGLADILLVPYIEVGNAVYKALVYFGKAKVGAVITGAKAPIVLTSRSDSHETKLNSMILAVLSAQSE